MWLLLTVARRFFGGKSGSDVYNHVLVAVLSLLLTIYLAAACRFPGGESGSDVYNRVSIFEDHLIRDMKAGRFSQSTSLCLVTHGLTMRVFLMRWFNWTVESFLQVSEQEVVAQNFLLIVCVLCIAAAVLCAVHCCSSLPACA
jgi:hypothetical protein